ncbi:MAG: hypothetical protein ACRCTR_01405 [Actinomycetota bacterium]
MSGEPPMPGRQDPSMHAYGDGAVRSGPLPESAAWNVLSTLISSQLGFGLPAWFVGRWLGWDWLVGCGMVAGAVVALTIIWFRYGTYED